MQTVREYIENRPTELYGKKIRVLDVTTHKNLGEWLRNADKKIKDIKITEKIIFIFVK